MKKHGKVWLSLTLILQFGLNMLVPICLCIMLGVWLGEKFGIPWLAVPLFFIGALAGFTNIYKLAKKIYGQDGDTDKGHA